MKKEKRNAKGPLGKKKRAKKKTRSKACQEERKRENSLRDACPLEKMMQESLSKIRAKKETTGFNYQVLGTLHWNYLSVSTY